VLDSRQERWYERRLGDELLGGATRAGAPGGQPPTSKLVDRPKLWSAKQLQAMRQPKFLAKNRIPLGAATILCGDEGIGKSLFWVLVVAAVTTGRAMPALGIPARDPADVILVLTEDDWAETVLPRLTVAGADMDRISVICADDDGTGSPTFPDDMGLILDADPAPALIVIDAWLDTVPSNLMVRDAQQSRAALHPWKEAAAKTGAAVLLLTHSNRVATSNMRDKYGATAALRQKARMTLYALADPDDGTLIIGPDKANGAPTRTNASRFRILAEQYFNPTPDHDGTVPSLQFVGETKPIKEHLLDLFATEQRKPRQGTEAEQWLAEYLADGPHLATEVEKAAAGGFSAAQLRRAKDRIAHSVPKPDADGTQRWYWELTEEYRAANDDEAESA
jgi:hypothetical protein